MTTKPTKKHDTMKILAELCDIVTAAVDAARARIEQERGVRGLEQALERARRRLELQEARADFSRAVDRLVRAEQYARD